MNFNVLSQVGGIKKMKKVISVIVVMVIVLGLSLSLAGQVDAQFHGATIQKTVLDPQESIGPTKVILSTLPFVLPTTTISCTRLR